MTTQIGFAHIGFLTQHGAAVGRHDAAQFHDVAIVRMCQCNGGVLLHHQNRCARFLADAADDVEDFFGQQWRKTQRGFIEHQQLRLRHVGAADGQHLLLAAGQQACVLLRPFQQTRKPLKYPIQVLSNALGIAACVSPHVEVFPDIEEWVDLATLGHQHQAPSAYLIGVQAVDVLVVQQDLAFERIDHPCQGVEQGGFTCAIGPQHRHHLSFFNLQVHPLYGGNGAVPGFQVAYFQQGTHAQAPK